MSRRHIGWLLTVVQLGIGGSLVAETQVTGSAGFDLQAYGFRASLHDTAYTYSARRSMSNHFITADVTGHIINENFASYAIGAGVLGSFIQSSTESSSANFYEAPELNSYSGLITLFPGRRYPLRLMRIQQRDNLLQYELQNRMEVESVQPSLSVVRRYRKENTLTTAALKVDMSENASFLSRMGWSDSKTFRLYDFDEDRDIWTDLFKFPVDELAETHTVQVVNELPDADVRIVIDGIDTTLVPEELAQLTVDSGYQQVYIIPLRHYNQYQFVLKVDAEMVLKILYVKPAAPRDLESEGTDARLQLNIGSNGDRSDVASYERSDNYDPTINQTMKREVISNVADWTFSEIDKLQLNTSYRRSETTRGSTTAQLSKILSHVTGLIHAPRRGLTASASHEYTQATSTTGGATVESQHHRMRSRAGYEFRKLSYRVDLKSDISLKDDNVGTGLNQYAAGIGNQMEVVLLGFRWQPTNTADYSIRDRKNLDGDPARTTIIETSFNLHGTSLRSTFLGNIALKSTYSYRKQKDEEATDIKKTYGFDLLLTRRLAPGYQLGLLTVQKWEDYGSPESPPGAPADLTTARPSDRKTTYRGDFSATPSENLLLSLSYGIMSERISTTKRFNVTVNTKVPRLNMPLQSSLAVSSREIGDLPPQTTLILQTEVTYYFREIVLTLEHKYSREKLVFQTFDNYELIGKLFRRFSV